MDDLIRTDYLALSCLTSSYIHMYIYIYIYASSSLSFLSFLQPSRRASKRGGRSLEWFLGLMRRGRRFSVCTMARPSAFYSRSLANSLVAAKDTRF
jgi:hypothetical protein